MRYLVSLIVALFALNGSGYANSSNVTNIPIEIYTIRGCFGCERAKSMFSERGLSYREISLNGRPDLYAEMKRRAGGNLQESMTVPRIFINGKYIGGYSDIDSSMLDKLVHDRQFQSNLHKTSTKAPLPKSKKS